MNLISLKEYAKEKHVSYEAIRQQVSRYRKELGKHIIKDGRQQFLDEEAVAFLDERRKKNPIILMQQDKNERIEELEEQVNQLLAKLAEQAEKIAQLTDWKAENILLIAEAVQRQELLQEKTQEVVQLENCLLDANAEIAILKKEKENLSGTTAETEEKLRLMEQQVEKLEKQLETNPSFLEKLRDFFRKKN